MFRSKSALLILTFVILTIGALSSCSKKDSPAAPVVVPPADTSTFTYTPSFTATPTATTAGYCGGALGTCTFSPTPTNSPTFTSTPTATETFTPTLTNTPTNTPTSTFTGQCGGAFGTCTFTNTPTFTYTSTSTRTYTPSFTYTSTPNITNTFTSTPTSAYRITGNVSYSGSLGTISASVPLVIYVTTSFNGGGNGTMVLVESNGGSFSAGVPSAGTYYMAVFMGPLVGDGNPAVGKPYTAYNGQCDTNVATAINVSAPGNTNIGTVSFADSCVFSGVYGNIIYTGTSSVNSNSPLMVESYSDSGYTNKDDGKGYIYANDSRYDLTLMGSTGTHYLRAYLDMNYDGSLSSCEPYINMGGFTPGVSTQVNITFGDTNRYSCTNYISGTVNFSGGTVDSIHPIRIQSQPYGGGGNNPSTTVSTNGGAYLVGSVSGNNTIIMSYSASGISSGNHCSSCINVGDYYEIYNNSPTFSGTAINASPTANVNLSFDTTYRFTGLVGTLNYTGAGAVDCDSGSGGRALGLMLTSQSVAPITTWYSSTDNCQNNQLFNLADWSNMPGSPHSTYLVAYYDSNGNQNFDAGDKYDIFGPFTTDFGDGYHTITFNGTYTK